MSQKKLHLRGREGREVLGKEQGLTRRTGWHAEAECESVGRTDAWSAYKSVCVCVCVCNQLGEIVKLFRWLGRVGQ